MAYVLLDNRMMKMKKNSEKIIRNQKRCLKTVWKETKNVFPDVDQKRLPPLTSLMDERRFSNSTRTHYNNIIIHVDRGKASPTG